MLEYKSELVNIKPVTIGQNIIDWMGEAGFYSVGMNGPTLLTWQDLNAWFNGVDTDVTREEKLLMRSLSREYCAQYSKSDNRDEPCPVLVQVQDKAALDSRIKSVFRSKKPSK